MKSIQSWSTCTKIAIVGGIVAFTLLSGYLCARNHPHSHAVPVSASVPTTTSTVRSTTVHQTPVVSQTTYTTPTPAESTWFRRG